MMVFRLIVIWLLMNIAFQVAAQDEDRDSKTAESAKKAESATVNMKTATVAKPATLTRAAPKTHPNQSGPGSISAKDTGGVLTLCCGAVDPHEMTGSNCAYMHTGQACAGQILACPPGTDDTVQEDGSGYCKGGG
jgi:hypothetical protein